MRTEDETVSLGQYAKALVSNDAFNVLYREYTDSMLSRIIESQPHETKVREFEYAQVRAMTGFINHLVGLAEAAEKIIQKNDNPVQDPDEAGLDLED